MTEITAKLDLLRGLLAVHDLDAILLRRVANFAWLTDGATGYVNTAADFGAASLLATRDCHYVVTSNIEAPRLEAEESLHAQGFRFQVEPWHKSGQALAELTRGLRLGADAPHPAASDLSADVNRLRLTLTPAEGERFRTVGRICAEAMNAAIRQVRPGMSEYAMAAALSRETQARGAQPIVLLAAADERIFRFRHPLPTDKRLERYAILVLGARKFGLVGSISRLIHFGPLPEELRRKERACAQIDAVFIGRTRPGARIADVFQAAVETYAAEGFADEWQLHHQGGAAGYLPREFVGSPTSDQVVQAGQAYAWNPSISGVKSEDTILIGPAGNEILTAIPDWPMIAATAAGQTWQRPAILQM